MSRDSYTRNRNNNKKQNNNAAAEVGGALILGAVALPAAAAGLAVYGTFKAVEALTKFGVKSYRKRKAKKAEELKRRQQEAKAALQHHRAQSSVSEPSRGKVLQEEVEKNLNQVHQYYLNGTPLLTEPEFGGRKISDTALKDGLSSLEALEAEHKEHLEKLEHKQLAALEQMRDALSNAAGDTRHFESFVASVSQKQKQILSSWTQQQEQFQKHYVSAISDRQKKFSENLSNTYQDMLFQVQKFRADNAAYQQRMKELALLAMHDAQTMLRTLAKTPGTAAYACDAVRVMSAAYQKCGTAFKAGQYGTAYLQAQDIALQSTEVLTDVLKKYSETQVRLDALTARAAVLSEQISHVDDVSFTHKGIEYKENLHRFNERGFNAARRKINDLWMSLHNDMTTQEFLDAEQELTCLERNFRNIYNQAWEKMAGSYYCNDIARDITAAIQQQGFQLEGYAHEEGRESEKLHINYKNPISGDKMTVVMNADSSGAPEISLHQYGSDFQQIPDASFQRKMTEIVSKAAGTAMDCSNAGEKSHNFEASDLDNITNKNYTRKKSSQ